MFIAHSSNGAFLAHLKQKQNENIENEHNMINKNGTGRNNTSWLYTSLTKNYCEVLKPANGQNGTLTNNIQISINAP